MERKSIGIIIKYYREKYSIPLEDLADGICSAATLFRIEMGERDADSLLAEALLSRLGKSINKIELILDEHDYKLWMIRNEIEKGIKEETDITDPLEKYKKAMPKEKIHQQYYTYSCARNKMIDHAPKREVLEKLEEALNITKPQRKGESRKKGQYNLFSFMEVNIIYTIFKRKEISEISMEERSRLLEVLDFSMKFYSDHYKQKICIPIFYELALIYKQEENYKDALEYAERGIALIADSRKYVYAAEFHFLKAVLLELYFGKKENWPEQKNICAEECLYAYYIYQFDEKESEKVKVENFLREKLECQITKRGKL